MAPAELDSRRYRLFGLTLDSDVEFATHLERASGRGADLRFGLRRGRPALKLPEAAYTSRVRTESGEAALTVHRRENDLAMCFPGGLLFALRPDAITTDLPASPEAGEFESFLFGPVFSLWLELRGLLVLHASSVATRHGAVGFLAGPRAGKSSLAAELVAHGHPLLGDDLMALEPAAGAWVARPAFPQLKLWPDSCRRVHPAWRSLPRVHPDHNKRRLPIGRAGLGSWRSEATPLAVLYLPERHDEVDQPRIESLPARERWLELVRHSFVARAVEALGMQPERFDHLAWLAADVPLRRLVLPPGLGRLDEARAAIEADLDRTA